MNQAKLQEKIEQIIDYKKDLANKYRQQHSKNKDVIEIIHRIEGKISAYLSVLHSLRGDNYLLNCDLTGRIDQNLA